MKNVLVIGATVAMVCSWAIAEEVVLVARWSFEGKPGAAIVDDVGKIPGQLKGKPEVVAGAEGQAWLFDGAFITVPGVPALQFGSAAFSLAAWVNPHEVGNAQQMIIGKNCYAAGQREWGLMIDHDKRFHFYVSSKGWKHIGSQTEPQPGRWYHVAVTFEQGVARLYINGQQEAEGRLGPAGAATAAPLGIAAIANGGHPMQAFFGALDEVAVYRGVLAPAAIRALAAKQPAPHPVESSAAVELWTGGAVPKIAELATVAGVRVAEIKPAAPRAAIPDGWKKGVHLAWHKDQLYVQFGYNKLERIQGENTKGEEALYLTSADGGETWGDVRPIASGTGEVGISHGVFLSQGGKLWSFNGAFLGSINAGTVHTRAFTLDEAAGRWEPRGTVIEKGFWPLQEPLQLADGNWIMSGARVGEGNPAAVAISRGADLLQWDLVIIPKARRHMWGESAVLLDGRRVTNLARYGAQSLALVAESEDSGRTWTASRPSNLPMTTSRPFAGVLSTGQRYLICTTAADCGTKRAPLTIAVSRPGERGFCRIFKIDDGHGTYPAAAEHAGVLYVGWTGAGMRPFLARLPVSALAVP